MSSLHDMPGHLVRRVHQISSALFAAECAEHGLTSVQFAALVAIRENPDVDATRLSSLVAFDRSTLGDVLERLELRGWVVRRAAPRDRRVKRLRLSPAGRAVVAAVEPAVLRVQDRLLAPLSGKNRARMVRLLTRLVEAHGGEPLGAAGARE